MDLTIKIENAILNIRVAVLIKGSKGYLFEKSKLGHVFCVGGRIKANESSLEAASREVEEELGFKTDKLKLRGMIENFYKNNDGDDVHEICFVYEAEDAFLDVVPPEFVEVSVDDVDSFDVRPKVMIEFIVDEGGDFKHVVGR
jgi:8-oxo-dGTP pyrophosphatase MutT (NUDIX family)